MTVASWAGMRGVVTLVAVLSLPQEFPERDRLIFVAFVVIAVTMLLQGLTLPWLVRRLDVSASDDERDEAEQALIQRARMAGFERLDKIRETGDVDADVVEQATENANRMWHSIGFAPDGHTDGENVAETRHAQRREGRLVGGPPREAVVESRTESGTDPLIADRVLRRLDTRGSQPE